MLEKMKARQAALLAECKATAEQLTQTNKQVEALTFRLRELVGAYNEVNALVEAEKPKDEVAAEAEARAKEE